MQKYSKLSLVAAALISSASALSLANSIGSNVHHKTSNDTAQQATLAPSSPERHVTKFKTQHSNLSNN